ncbi:MAG: flagellar biosynthesis protein FlgC, partial [Spirochaetaceae bacterium]|nr:flagellar biosynthesis protein FlgC [Spirochaetaceae bacterium]
VNRAYEANQKTIQSEDSMMSTLWSKVATLR